MVAGQPFLEFLAGHRPSFGRDRLHLRRVDRELDEQTVRILGVEAPAVAVLQDEGSLRFPSGIVETLGDGVLKFGRNFEGDVAERRRDQLGIEQIGVFLVGELEERQCAAVAEFEERVAIDAFGPEQLVGFRPRGDEWQTDQIFVEGSGRLLVLGDVCIVVQPRRKFGGHVVPL